MRPSPGTVVVIGSINVDLVVSTTTLPAPGETVGGGTFSQGAGGKGGNQAAAAAGLGARTFVVGRVGADAFGEQARLDLLRAGVDDTYLTQDATEATGIALVVVDAGGENAIAVAPGANARVSAEQAVGALQAIGARLAPSPVPAVLLLSLEVPVDTVLAAATHARAQGWRVVLNPAPAQTLPRELIAAADVLTPNAVEVEALHADGVDGLLGSGAGVVVVTRGAHGVDIHCAGSPVRRLPAFPVRVVDTTGAGDAFNAGLAWGLATGLELEDAVGTGIAAGALTVTHPGARAPLDAAHALHDAGGALPDRDDDRGPEVPGYSLGLRTGGPVAEPGPWAASPAQPEALA